MPVMRAVLVILDSSGETTRCRCVRARPHVNGPPWQDGYNKAPAIGAAGGAARCTNPQGCNTDPLSRFKQAARTSDRLAKLTQHPVAALLANYLPALRARRRWREHRDRGTTETHRTGAGWP